MATEEVAATSRHDSEEFVDDVELGEENLNYFEDEENLDYFEDEEYIDPEEFKEDLVVAKVPFSALHVSYKGQAHDGFRRDRKLHEPKLAATRKGLMEKVMARTGGPPRV